MRKLKLLTIRNRLRRSLNNLHSFGPVRGDGSYELIHLDHNLALPATCRNEELDHLKTFCMFPWELVDHIRAMVPSSFIDKLRAKYVLHSFRIHLEIISLRALIAIHHMFMRRYWGGALKNRVLKSLESDSVFSSQLEWVKHIAERLDQVDARLEMYVQHVDQCVKEFGEEKVLHSYEYARRA